MKQEGQGLTTLWLADSSFTSNTRCIDTEQWSVYCSGLYAALCKIMAENIDHQLQ
jgi:hypothetical protein